MEKSKLKNYKAIILAGGKGTRLYPVTLEMPKPLLPVGKKPMINYLVDLFYSYGIKDVAILINANFQEDFEWWKKRYYPESSLLFAKEEKPLGTFGGLGLLKNWTKGGPFFLANADNLTTVSLPKMANFHKKYGNVATIALAEVENPKDYGVVVCEKNLVKEFVEKPDKPVSKHINSGWYLLNSEIFNYYNGLEFSMIEKDIFPKLAKESNLSGFKFRGEWIDCGTWDRYREASEKWKNFI